MNHEPKQFMLYQYILNACATSHLRLAKKNNKMITIVFSGILTWGMSKILLKNQFLIKVIPPDHLTASEN